MEIYKKNKTFDMISIAKKMLIAYAILQPIFDLYMNFFDEKIQIFGTSLATVLRYLIVLVMTGIVIFAKRKCKLTWVFVAYMVIIAIYTVIHHFNALGFSVDLALAEYNSFGELLYLSRMCIPLALIYVIYMIKPVYLDIKKIVISVSIIMSLVIIISNLLKIGYVAYDTGKTPISDNMISWFMGTDIKWTMLTCRGLFQWTNQVSAVMLLFVPFLTYVCVKESKVFYWVTTVLHLIAMMNIGTRIASLGGILVFVGMIFLHYLENIIHKEKFKKQVKNTVCIMISLVLLVAVFNNSPIKLRSVEGGMLDDVVMEQEEKKENSNKNKKKITMDDIAKIPYEEKMEYIEKHFPTSQINELYFKEAYPCEEDCDFWYYVIKYVPLSDRAGNRNMRSYLVERILERDGRLSNYIWGISYTRSSSFVWPERDIETHFDSLGTVGVILFLGPYFLTVIIGIWYFFRRFKENTRLNRCVYLISSGLGIVNAYLSGHIMNEIFPFVFLSLMMGMTLNSALTQKSAEEVVKQNESNQCDNSGI